MYYVEVMTAPTFVCESDFFFLFKGTSLEKGDTS
jgi:hypothetical protein